MRIYALSDERREFTIQLANPEKSLSATAGLFFFFSFEHQEDFISYIS
jgi:hypothetical protein